MAAPVALGFALWGPNLAELVGGVASRGPRSLYLAFATLGLVTALASPVEAVLSGRRSLRPTLVLSLTSAVVNIVLSIVFTLEFGISGPVFASAISVALLLVGQLVMVGRDPTILSGALLTAQRGPTPGGHR